MFVELNYLLNITASNRMEVISQAVFILLKSKTAVLYKRKNSFGKMRKYFLIENEQYVAI